MDIKNVSEFAREQGISRQVVEHRIKAGWVFGTLNDEQVWYNPKSIHKMKIKG